VFLFLFPYSIDDMHACSNLTPNADIIELITKFENSK
jgi:hypothetical protein